MLAETNILIACSAWSLWRAHNNSILVARIRIKAIELFSDLYVLTLFEEGMLSIVALERSKQPGRCSGQPL
jgi:hypothetical protein